VKMATILITGKNGQLGQELQELTSCYKDHHFLFMGKEDLDLTSATELKHACTSRQIDYIINCAAYTKVDLAESEKDAAQAINHKAVQEMGVVARENGIRVIHLSTDYVFSGNHYKPYSEEDSPNPISQYGLSKWEGEKALQETRCEHIIIRTSWLYSPFRSNFLKTMLQLGHEKPELKVVFDQIGTPTYAKDLAAAILDIISGCESGKLNFATGIYHYSNEGACSWYDFAREIQDLANTDCNIIPIEEKDFPTIAPRPYFSVLNKSKIKHIFEIEIPYWKDSLNNCLKRLKEI